MLIASKLAELQMQLLERAMNSVLYEHMCGHRCRNMQFLCKYYRIELLDTMLRLWPDV